MRDALFLFVVSVLSLFALAGCNHPARVDIGALVEELRALDADASVDTDEVTDDLLDEEQQDSDEPAENDVFDSADVTDSADVMTDKEDVETLPDEDVVEQEPEDDAVITETEANDDAITPDGDDPLSDDVVTDYDFVCGNFTLEEGETCELDQGGISCASVLPELPSGVATCNSSCTGWVTDNCYYYKTAGIQSPTATTDARWSNGSSYFVGGYADVSYDIIAVKLDLELETDWTKSWGTASEDWAWGVDVDADGNVFIVGSTGGDLDGNVNSGIPGQDPFIAKLDMFGNREWTKQWGPHGMARRILVENSGDMLLSGETTSQLLLRKTDSLGNMKWERKWNAQMTGSGDRANAMTVDGDGNILLAGYTYGYYTGFTTASGATLLCKRDADGYEVWNRQWGNNTGTHTANGVAVDSTGNIYVTGTAGGAFDGYAVGAGGYSIFLTKWDSSGNKLWTRVWGSSDINEGNGVAIDPVNGGIFVVGRADDTIDGAVGNGAAFITKWSPSGTKMWTKQFAGVPAKTVSIDNTGKVYVQGMTNSTVFFAIFQTK